MHDGGLIRKEPKSQGPCLGLWTSRSQGLIDVCDSCCNLAP